MNLSQLTMHDVFNFIKGSPDKEAASSSFLSLFPESFTEIIKFS